MRILKIRSLRKAIRLRTRRRKMATLKQAQQTLARLSADPSLCGAVDIEASPEQLAHLLDHTRTVWSGYGEKDPYYSVLTRDEFKMEAINVEQREIFYETGAPDLEALLKACERNRLDIPLDGTIVDFGCGVGRSGEYFSAKFRNYIGIDISSSHLAKARARFTEKGRRNARFILLNDYLDQPIEADAFVSLIALQHNPPPIIAMLLNKLCARLRPGGIAYFQVPTAIFDYEFRLEKYLNEMPMHGAMEMHVLPQHEVFKILDRNKCRPCEIFPDGKAGSIGISMTFVARKAEDQTGSTSRCA